MAIKTLLLVPVLAICSLLGLTQSLAQPSALTDQQIFDLQLRDIEQKVRGAFATEARIPEINLVSILSGHGVLDYKGRAPHALPSVDNAMTEVRREENRKARIATEQLRFTEAGDAVISNVAGRITITGTGDGFSVFVPGCPIAVCGERELHFSLNSW